MKDDKDDPRWRTSQPPPGGSFDRMVKTLLMMMLLVMVAMIFMWNCSCVKSCNEHMAVRAADAATKADGKGGKARTEFVKGMDYGRSFLKPKSKKGQKYRAGLRKMIRTYRAWVWKYGRYDVVPIASRIWLESRGNYWSHTKDTYLLEAGLTSVSYEDARKVCAEFGVCGDPCGDPRLAISITEYARYRQRVTMLYDPEAEGGGKNFWHPWLAELAEYNQWEAEAFAGSCGALNCQKLRKAIMIASKQDGFMTHEHKWWRLMKWFRDLSEEETQFIFEGVKRSIWQVGTRIGRVEAQIHMRAEFKKPKPDGSPDYGFGPGFAYFPMRVEMRDVDGVLVPTQVPDFPVPLKPYKKFPKPNEWRTECVLYGSPAWDRVTGEPKASDRWKTAGFKYHPATGAPITVKKGQKKYPTKDDLAAAHAVWLDAEVAAGRLPTPEENEAARIEMEADGYLPVE